MPGEARCHFIRRAVNAKCLIQRTILEGVATPLIPARSLPRVHNWPGEGKERIVVGGGLVATLFGFLALTVIATLVLLYFVPNWKDPGRFSHVLAYAAAMPKCLTDCQLPLISLNCNQHFRICGCITSHSIYLCACAAFPTLLVFCTWSARRVLHCCRPRNLGS